MSGEQNNGGRPTSTITFSSLDEAMAGLNGEPERPLSTVSTGTTVRRQLQQAVAELDTSASSSGPAVAAPIPASSAGSAVADIPTSPPLSVAAASPPLASTATAAPGAPTSRANGMYFGPAQFVQQAREEVRLTETVSSRAAPGSFRDIIYFFNMRMLGLRFPEDAKRNDYILGSAFYLLNISILVVTNYMLNATLWTGIIEGIEKNKFPGNTRVPDEFLVANIANEYLSPATVFYDSPTGTRERLPTAFAALLGIFVGAGVLRLLALLIYKVLKRGANEADTSVNADTAAASETTLLLQTTEAPTPAFVTLVDRYNEVNTWRVFSLPLISNTIGTFLTFAIINAIALNRVTYPDIPGLQTIQSGNNPLDDPRSYMLLLTLVSLATSLVPGITVATAKPLITMTEQQVVSSENVIVTRGENPLYESQGSINGQSLGNDASSGLDSPITRNRCYCC